MPNLQPTELPRRLRVLIVHHPRLLLQSLADALGRAGMEVLMVDKGAQAVDLAIEFSPAIALVGLELQDVSSSDLIEWFARRDVGIIGLDDDADDATQNVIALELGAADCVRTTITPRELAARIRAVHRRTGKPRTKRQDAPALPPIAFGPIRISPLARTVFTAEHQLLKLTSAEFNALEVLASLPGEAVSRETLSLAALHRPWRAEERNVDQLMFSLRQKLPLAHDGRSLIQTVRCAGYLLRSPAPAERQAA